jgi:hypothetical protein
MQTTDMMVRNRKINAVSIAITAVVSNVVSNAATKTKKWQQYYGKTQNT